MLQLEIEKKFEGVEDIPLPPFWGGYRVSPKRIEFWEGRIRRLNDRIEYVKSDDGDWLKNRLSP